MKEKIGSKQLQLGSKAGATKPLNSAAKKRRDKKYIMQLFVTGTMPKSTLAIENVKKLCDEHLPNQYDLQIIDICQQPEATRKHQIIAAPTLIMKQPLPLRRFVGGMSDKRNFLVELDARKKHKGEKTTKNVRSETWNEDLQQRLREAEETLTAIRNGEVDAVIVNDDRVEYVYSLSDAERFYRQLFEEMSEGALTVSEGNVILYCNHQFAEMVGVSIEKIVGMSILDLVVPIELELVKKTLDKARRRGRSKIKLSLAKNGATIRVLFSCSRLVQDAPIVSVVVTDLTEHNLLEVSSASARLWRSVFESSNDAILLFDSKLNVKGFNANALGFYGYTKDELLKRNLWDLRRSKVRRPIAKLKSDLLLPSGLRYETEHVAKDGTAIPVEVSTRPFEVNGNRYIVFTIRNIVHRKRTEQQIQHNVEEMVTLSKELRIQNEELDVARQRYQNLFEFTPDAYIVTTLKGFIEEVNKAAEKLLNLGASTLKQMSIIEFAAKNNTGSLKGALLKSRKDRKPKRIELSEVMLLRGKKKHSFYADIVVEPVFERNGIVSALRWLVRDVTERKQTEDALHQGEERHRVMAETMLQGVVHQNADGTVISMNSAAERILGVRRANFLGSSSVTEQKHTTREDGSPFPGMEHPAMVALRTGRSIRGVVMGVFNPADNRRRWISIDAIPLFRKGEKRPYQVYTIFEDITERKQVEEATRRQAELLQLSFDAIIVWRLGGTIESWNKGAEELYGYSAAEAIGRRTHDLFGTIHPVPWSEIRAQLRRHGRWEGELRHHAKDGRELIVSARHQVVRGPNGVDRILEINRDITEHKRAEDDLRESEERYRRLFEDDLTGDYLAAPDGKIVLCNAAFARLYGFADAKEAIGFNFAECRGGVQKWKKLLHEVKDQRFVEQIETKQQRRDGTAIQIVENVVGIFDPSGKLTHVMGYTFDITERVRAEEARHESEARYHELYQNVPIGIYRSTPDGRILMVNPALLQMLGYDSFDNLAKRNLEVDGYAPGYSRKDFKHRIERDGEVRGHEVAWKKKDGSLIFIRENAKCVRDENGKVLYYEGTVEDITKRKRAEEALEEQRRFLRQVVDLNPSMIFAKDREGRFTFVNQAVADTYGTTVEKLIGKSDNDFNPNKDEVEFFHRMDLEVMDSSQVRRIPEEKITDVRGRVRWLQTTKIPLTGNDGKVRQVLGVATDITERKRSEEALIVAEERFRLASEATGYGTFDFDPRTWKIVWSKLTKAHFGLSSDADISYDLFIQGLHPEDRERINDIVQTILRDKSGGEFHTEFRTIGIKDGIERWIDARGQVYFDTDGTPMRFIGTTVDITAQKKAEESLQKYSRAIKQSPASIIITDTNGTIEYVNPKFIETTGYRSEEVIGQNPRILKSGITPIETYQSLWKTLTSGEEWHGEFVNRKKDGSLYWEIASISPVRNTQGTPTHYVAVKEDVTERKRAEDALRQQAALIDLSPDAIIVRDIEGTISFWSRGAEDLYGWKSTEALGKKIGELLKTEFPIPFEQFLDELKTRGRWTGELVHATKDGRMVIVRSRWLAQPGRNGQPDRYLETNVDITVLKRTEGELRKLNEELEDRVQDRTKKLESTVRELEGFSYSVSHDLRAPLRAISGFAGALKEDYSTTLDLQAQNYLDIIQSNVRGMGQLIDDLLAFSRLSRKAKENTHVEMSKLVDEVVQEARTADESERRVMINIGELPPVEGDAAMLKQVWSNLIQNAFKFTRPVPEPRIEIGSQQKTNEIVYFVRDNGVGFDMAYADKLFGVFQRLHAAEDFEGTGIGLSIVQRIVERHLGKVWAESKPKEGATFYFSLPD